MTQSTLFRHIIIPALSLGLAGNFLLQNAQTAGLNLFLLFAILSGGALWILRQAQGRIRGEAAGWIGSALLLTTTGFLFRDTPALQGMAFVAAAAAFAFVTLRGGADWLSEGRILAPLEAVAGTIFHTAMGPIPRLTGPLFRGAVVAFPILIVFGALLSEADPIFAMRMQAFAGALIPTALVDHLILTTVLTWLAIGYLSGLLRGTAFFTRFTPWLPRPRLGAPEVNLVLGLVSVLFLGFVAVQLQVFVGGAAVVQNTPGLTYAAYAREGFGQLVVAIALILPLLLTGAWFVQHDASETTTAGLRQAQIFRYLGGLQVVLLLLMAASAIARVRIYHEAFGATEMRFYATIFLAWLMLMSLWLGITILRGEWQRFLPPMLVSAFAVVAGLMLVNPQAIVVRDQLGRGDRMDVAYVASLSADAIPTLSEAFPSLAPELQDALRSAWLERWGEAGPDARAWHSWNWAESRGRRLLAELRNP